MNKTVEIIRNISNIVRNDSSQMKTLLESRNEIFELIFAEISLKRLLADSFERAFSRFKEAQEMLNDDASPDEFCTVFDNMADLLISLQAEEDYPLELSEETGEWEMSDSAQSDLNRAYDNPNITAVMTLYKRPDRLVEQLDAIESQTFRPKEILLFQDHIDNGVYTIELQNEIKQRFSDVHVCTENVGVWDRFRYAYERAKSEYVCIFDDDTIPGKRWFENCYMHMIQQEAIYVTLGVSLNKPNRYPFRGWYRIGWGAPYQGNAEVDFGGHSWFVKKEHLRVMAQDNNPFHEKYKYVGEDAYLSYANLKENGVRTVVPRHYGFDKTTWGSNPDVARMSGTDNSAVSMNINNLNTMTLMIKDLENEGWEYVSCRHPDYSSDLYNRVKDLENNSILFPMD